MNSKLTRALPAAALIAAVMAVSASTGAVAAGMITGKDIKNGSVTSTDLKNNNVTGKDVKDGTLTGADMNATTLGSLKGATGPTGPSGAAGAVGPPGISGLQQVEATTNVPPGTFGSAVVYCPAGKKILGVSADWTSASLPATSYINPDLTYGVAYGRNTSSIAFNLRGSATCAFVS